MILRALDNMNFATSPVWNSSGNSDRSVSTSFFAIESALHSKIELAESICNIVSTVESVYLSLTHSIFRSPFF